MKLRHLLFYLFVSIIYTSANFSFNAQANSENEDYELALIAFHNQAFDEAHIHAKNSLQKNPSNLPANILLGNILIEQNRFEEAYFVLTESISLGADVNLIVEKWGLVLIRLGKLDELALLPRSQMLNNRNQLIWLQYKAQACVLQSNYACAQSHYTEFLERAPNSIKARNGLATLALINKDYTLANKYIEQVFAIDKQNAEAWRIKGQVAKFTNNLEEAVTSLQTAFDIDPTNDSISRNLVDVLIALGDVSSAKAITNDILKKTPNDLFVLFAQLWLVGEDGGQIQSQQLLENLSKKLSSIPDEAFSKQPWLRYLRGLVSYQKGNYEQAQNDFSSYQSLSDGDEKVAVLLAKSYMALGNSSPALRALEPYSKSLSQNADDGILLGNLYLQENKIFKAVPLANELLSKYPNNIDVHLFNIQILAVRNKLDDAIVNISLLLEQFPADERIIKLYSVFHLQAGKLNEALSAAEILVNKNPNQVDALNLKAAALIKLSRFEEAHILLNDILNTNQTSVPALYNLASLLKLEGRFAEAERTLQAILKSDANHLPSLILSAKIALLMGETERALEQLNSLHTEVPNNINVNEGLAEVNGQLANYKKMLVHVKRLQELSPKSIAYRMQFIWANIKLGNNDDAQGHIDTTKIMVTTDAENLLILSQFELSLNNFSAAEKTLKLAHSVAPNNTKVHLAWLKVLAQQGKLAQAKRELTQLAKTQSSNIQVRLLQGEIAESEGDVMAAATYFTNILAIDNDYDLALAKLFSLLPKGYSGQAFTQLVNQAVDQNPQRYFPRSLLAQYHYVYGDWQLAQVHYEHLLDNNLAPNRAALLSRLSRIYLKDDQEKSAKYSAEAYELSPNNISIASQHGKVLNLQGKYDQALSVLRKALARDSLNIEAQLEIVYSLIMLERNTTAEALLKKLVNMQLNSQQKQQAQQLSNKLGVE